MTLLDHDGPALAWQQQADTLVITSPAALPFATVIAFKIE